MDDSECDDVPVNFLEHCYGRLTTQSGEEPDRLASVLPRVWLHVGTRVTCIMTCRTEHTY